MFNIYGEYDPRTMYGVDWLPLGNEKPRRGSPQPKANPEPQEGDWVWLIEEEKQ